MHGDEPSGTDASLRLLRDVVDRTDCAARAVRRGAVVAVLPTQNPDGRRMHTRQNAYGFDLNRDWFARTQPETDGKLRALRRFPPALYLDVHEMGGTSYFMPPNADPIHHEITDRSTTWIDDLYGGAMARTFQRLDIDYFNRDVYDLLYMGYGDTVPTTAYLGAGMTLEKGGNSRYSVRVREQYLASWSSVVAGGKAHEELQRGIAASTRQAYRQGLAGKLEPNKVYEPGNEVETQVPDITVRHYFLRADDPDRTDEVTRIVRRLQQMDVEVYELTAPLDVPDYTPYGRRHRATTLPAGTYWVPMAQAQKHWVEAMLGEDSYVPFPYFYDVTAWSLPLLADVHGGRSGEVLDPAATLVPPMSEPQAPDAPDGAPAVGLWHMSPAYNESPGWLSWLLDQRWQLPYRPIETEDVRAGGLAGIDVLLVPDGYAKAVIRRLGESGARQLRSWLADGGRLVAWQGGARLAAKLALTTARFSKPTSDVPGSLIHVRLDPGSPLSDGVGNEAWNFYEYDWVMRETDPDAAPVSYPDPDSRAWSVSGFARGAGELGGTAAVVDEAYADGRVVLFASEPNFRAFTEGTQSVLWNAVVGPDPQQLFNGTQRQRDRAAAAAGRLTDLRGSLVVTVRPTAGSRAAGALAAAGVATRRVQSVPAGGLTRFVVPVAPGRTLDAALVRRVVAELAPLGDDVLAVYAPL